MLYGGFPSGAKDRFWIANNTSEFTQFKRFLARSFQFEEIALSLMNITGLYSGNADESKTLILVGIFLSST